MPTMPKDAADAFDTQVPAGLLLHPDKAREINAIYAFKIAGEGGGEWTADLTADPPTCTRGASATAQCTIEMDHVDFMTMLVTGDPMLAMKLQGLFALANG